MNKTLDIREIAIVLLASNHNPTILNPDFLKFNEIVPSNWEVTGSPLCVESFAQVVYKNGISIRAQFDRLTFIEVIQKKPLKSINVPEIASKYIETLHHVNYRAVGINPKGHVVANNQEEAKSFVLEKFIAPGPWKKLQGRSPKVDVQFNYPLDYGSLIIKIDNTFLPLSDNEKIHVVMFAGNIHRDINSETSDDKIQNLRKIIQLWNSDVDMFQNFIEENFLRG